MKNVILAVVSILMANLPVTGEATYYSKGVMKRVYEYRISVGDVSPCPECIGQVALLMPDDIGKVVWLKHPDGRITGPVQVIDCAQEQHREMLLEKGWVVDVSWAIAQEWGMRGPLKGVTVLFREPEMGQ